MPSGKSSLKEENKFFEENREQLLKHHRGQWALIKGRELIGTFSGFDEAYTAGVARYGNVPMLIRLVREKDPPEEAPALMHGLVRPHAE